MLYLYFIFSAIAGVMALMISYEEYNHHFSMKTESLKLALKTAFSSFIFFLVLGIILAIIFNLKIF